MGLCSSGYAASPVPLYGSSYLNYKAIGLTPLNGLTPPWYSWATNFTRAFADFSGSGRLDLFFADITYSIYNSPSEATPSVFQFHHPLSDGSYGLFDYNGILQPADTVLLPNSTGCIHPRKSLVADFNGDGRPDLFIACTGYDNVPYPGERSKVVLSQPDGTYKIQDASTEVGYFHGASAADLNGDGFIDVVVVNPSDPSVVYVLLNQGDGTFVREATPRLPAIFGGKNYYSVELVDVDGDGKLDIILGGHEFERATTVVLLNPGNNDFSAVQPIALPAVPNEGVALDFTVTGSGSDRAIWVLRTSGGNGVVGYQSITVQKVSWPSLNSMVVFNQDNQNVYYNKWLPWLIPATVNGQSVITYESAMINLSLAQSDVVAGRSNTSTTLQCVQVNGQSPTCTATVSGGNAPSGIVTFREGGTILGFAATATSGQASIQLTNPTIGSHIITAIYGGDPNNNRSSASLAQTVTIADTQAPSVPSGLAAIIVSNSQVNLSWTASTDNVAVTNYRVYRNGTQVSTSSNTSYNDTGLAASTTYNYTVQACDAALNCSAQSAAAIATITLDTVAPTVPGNPWASVVNASQVDLGWQPSTDNVGVSVYKVFRNGNAIAIQTVNASTTSWSDTTVVANTTYKYTIQACDTSANCSAQSLPAMALPVSQTGPNYATVNIYRNQSVVAVGSNTENFGFNLGYPRQPNDGLSSYSISCPGTTPVTGSFAAPPSTGNSWEWYGVGWGQIQPATPLTCTSKVTKTDATTNTVSITIDYFLPANSYPTNISLGFYQNASTAPSVSWTAATGYAYSGSVSVLNGPWVWGSPQQVTSPLVYAGPALTPNTSYIYNVNSQDSGGGNFSHTSSTTIPFCYQCSGDSTPPSVPLNVGAYMVSPTQVNVNWSQSTDNVAVGYYKVYRDGTLIAQSINPNFSDYTATAGALYQYAVAACDTQNNCSVASGATAVTTPTWVSFSPPNLNFLPTIQGMTSATQSLNLINYTSSQLTISSLIATGDFVVTLNSCSAGVVAGGSCSISVAFAPSAVGDRTGTLSISDNAPGNPQSVSLSGIGTAAITTPSAPIIGTATGGNGQAAVTFTAPTSNGGSPIVGYTVTSNPAGGTDSNAGTGNLTHVITGLANGMAYAFTVVAINSAGASLASAPSNGVIPAKISQDISFGASPTLVVGSSGIVSATGGASGNTVTLNSITPAICTIAGNTVTALAAGTCSVSANQAGNASYSAAPQVTQNIGVGQTTETILHLDVGWNLIGNGSSGLLDVAGAFGDSAKTNTVWKWIANFAKWAFYSPVLVGQALNDYATGKGYDVLTTINGGEGFWVNAKTAFTVSLPAGTTITSASFLSMPSGWNLIAVGDNKTPSQFNALAAPITPVTTLWAWDALQTNWYFYAPSLDRIGTLSTYITSKSYLNFETMTLNPTTGFWVNKP